MTEPIDFYAWLGVARTAKDAEIRRAYRKLASKHHPDRDGGDEEVFKSVQEAYACLSDPEKRARYDAFGKEDDRDAIELESAQMLFKTLVVEMIELRHHDVIEALRSRLASKRVAFGIEIERKREVLRLRTRWLGRIKRKTDGVNLAEEALAKKVDEARKEHADAEQSMRVNELVRAMLDEYEDIGDLSEILKIGQARLLQWGVPAE